MKPLFFLLVLIASSNSLNAQSAVTSIDVMPVIGEYPRNNVKYANLTSGSIFFKDEWMKSHLISPQKIIYNDVQVKLNLADDKIHFLDQNGKELQIKEQMAEIKMTDAAGTKYHFINTNSLAIKKKGWHQILVKDTVSLLKGFTKSIVEHKPYGSPIGYSMETTDTYHAVYKGEVFEIKKAADLLQLLPGKKTEIESNIKKLPKGQAKEEQLIAITTFINMIL